MRRTLITIAASSLVTVVLLAGVGLLVGRHLISSAFAAGPIPPIVAAQLPQEIKGLAQLPPEQRFGHFMGGEMRFSDVNNATHTVSATPGTVQSVSADALVLAPNDASLGAAKTFKLTSDTHIRQHARDWKGGESQTQLSGGDRVVVIAMDGDQARAVVVAGPEGFGPGHHFGPRARQ
jgi:hypothetical protein